MENISKSFPGVKALQGAQLELRRGEVLALMGENGAGKSTLVKILSGVYQPDEGTIVLDGVPRSFRTPIDARNAGVAIIHQEFSLVPTMSAKENLFLGNAPSRFGFISATKEREQALGAFRRLGAEIDPDELCRNLSPAKQQLVEIARALHTGGRILVMDEPTAALSRQDASRLLNHVRSLAKSGIGIIYISHRLDEVFEIADRVTVMRDGMHIASLPIGELSRPHLIELMVGRTLENEFPKEEAEIGPVRLQVDSVSRGKFVRNVSFSVRRGEMLGLAGLVGAGRTEVARLIFGADTADSGRVFVDGQEVAIRTPLDAIRAGISLLTEDRKCQGLVLNLTVQDNFSLPNLGRFSRAGLMRPNEEQACFDHHVEALRIRIPNRDQKAKNLSGGNQQKIVLAKWLETNSKILIFDEPTRGIDVGAKYEIYRLMCTLARQGKSIVMISSELPELLGMCDRILIMHEGTIRGEITDVRNATQEAILSYAVGQPAVLSSNTIPGHDS